jgi:uncharacterized protein YndB with AHSA1/START domain
MIMTGTNELVRDFTLTRMLDAPRALVFQAWTDPDHLQWFFNNTVAAPPEPIEVDLRVGGVWKLKMVINDDLEYFTGGVYREIVPVEKLAFTWGATDGWPEIDPDRPEDGPLVTVTLNEVGDKTEMIFNVALPGHLPEERVREWLATGMREGWGDTIDRLVARCASAATKN